MSKKKIRFSLYYDAFSQEQTHLGFKFNNNLYCLTHSKSGNSSLIDPFYLDMKDKPDKNCYIKPALNQKAKRLNTTNMFANKNYILSKIAKLKIKN